MSSSAINQSVFSAKVSNIQNAADTSSIYSAGVWSFKNSTALTSVTITDAGAVTLGPSGFTGNHVVNGNVGIGTASKITGLEPFTQFTVSGSNGGIAINSTNTAASDYSRLCFTKQGATGNEGVIRYNTNDYHMGFFTNATERMRIDASGNLLVGATSPIDAILRIHAQNASSNGQYSARSTVAGAGKWWQFGASANAYIIYNQSSVGQYMVDGQTTWAANSDQRMKKNIKPLELGLEQVKALKPARFDYNSDESEESARVGFIAQEVLPVLPHAVHVPEDSEQMMGVSATEMIPVLVKAIQELSAQVEELKAKLL